MDEKGNYHYGHFDEYFSDPKRVAYLLYDENTLVGFAMLNPYSCNSRLLNGRHYLWELFR